MSGWYHPAPADNGRLAVLICPPIGDEAIAAHLGLRKLACDLAAAGMPTLRFDPAGTGDSADPPDVAEGDQVAVWLRSIESAATALRAASGVRSVALIGLRNGSLLAAHAALAIDGIAALVALVPVPDGRSYLRECRLLRSSLGQQAPSDGSMLAGGHRFNRATADRLARLDWRAAGEASMAGSLPPPRPATSLQALVIDRADRPAGRACAERLREQGTAVVHENHADLDRLATMAHQAVFPAPVAARIVDWLAGITTSCGRAAAPGDPTALRTGPILIKVPAGELIQEQVCIDSAPTLLAGVVTRRCGGAQAGGRRGIVMLTSGSERLVGPHRIFTVYARERAARDGDIVLRLDRAGIGDSEPRPGGRENDPFDAGAVADVEAAVAFLRTVHGVAACSLVGFCAGAYHGWRAAVGGLDVDRLVSVNPVAFTASDSRQADPRRAALQVALLADARRSFVDLQRWRQLLRGELRLRGIGIAVFGRARAQWADMARSAARLARRPMADDLNVDLAAVDRRGIRQSFVFSADEPGWTLLRKQGGSVLKRLLRKGRVQVEHLGGADHSCTTATAQVSLRAALHAALDASSEPRADAAIASRAGVAAIKRGGRAKGDRADGDLSDKSGNLPPLLHANLSPASPSDAGTSPGR